MDMVEAENKGVGMQVARTAHFNAQAAAGLWNITNYITMPTQYPYCACVILTPPPTYVLFMLTWFNQRLNYIKKVSNICLSWMLLWSQLLHTCK